MFAFFFDIEIIFSFCGVTLKCIIFCIASTVMNPQPLHCCNFVYFELLICNIIQNSGFCLWIWRKMTSTYLFYTMVFLIIF